ncbi:MAG: signal peptidase I [Gemmatales bacterium]
MSSLVVYAVNILTLVLVTALYMWKMAAWVRSPNSTLRRSILTSAVIWVCSILSLLLNSYLDVPIPILIGLVIVDMIFIQYVFVLKFVRALVVFGAYVLGCITVIFLGRFVVRPYIMESIEVNSNSMAPTLVARHHLGVCPQCGSAAIIPISEHGFFHQEGICSNCRAVNTIEPQKILTEKYGHDQCCVNKWLKPRRWDVVVHRANHDDRILYAFRLVGLPGETMMIRDGAVWINDVKQELPSHVGPIQYLADSIDRANSIYGPITLKSGEVFVLGDYSASSSDSRVFGVVPEANIVGVVDLIYWPMKRMRILR